MERPHPYHGGSGRITRTLLPQYRMKNMIALTGIGYDIHRFAEVPRPLMLGGVHIPSSRGLDGHSDADVLCHAIADALLGAAGLPDIGY